MSNLNNEGQAKRRPIPRKGHTKSRAGCANCKRRKVKCNEDRPQCASCLRLGLQCSYLGDEPQAGSSTTASTPGSSVVSLGRTLSTDPSWFQMSDMRFFQHFLFSAYPSLPLNGWDVWQDVSQMSHEYDFLVHAMLGLGASHLSLLTEHNYMEAAINHRLIALKGLNRFLETAHESIHHADAAFAASLVLTFQSTQLVDGLNDFLTMIRGCHLVGTNVLQNFDQSRFRTFERDIYLNYLNQMIPHDSPFPFFKSDKVDEFCASARRVACLCRSVQELEYLTLMQRIALQAQRNPLQGHDDHTKLYDTLGAFTAEEFATFIDPENYSSQLIILHMLILDYVMGSTVIEGRVDSLADARIRNMRSVFDYRKAMLVVWTSKVAANLPPQYRTYAEWPLKFAKECVTSDSSPSRIHALPPTPISLIEQV